MGPVSVPTSFPGPAIMHVHYEIALVTCLDILGFKDLIATRDACEISRILRAFKEAVEPAAGETQFKQRDIDIPEDGYVNFSDLSLIVRPFGGYGVRSLGSQLFDLLLHIVRAQARLVIDEGILIRGAVAVGKVVKTREQVFGPAVVCAYELERKAAKYPRIIVDKGVFEALNSLQDPWYNDEHTDRRHLRLLTRRDTDRRRFVDYMRAVQSELADPAYYSFFLDRHDEFIQKGLQLYSHDHGILPKYEWLKCYHQSTIGHLNRGRPNSA